MTSDREPTEVLIIPIETLRHMRTLVFAEIKRLEDEYRTLQEPLLDRMHDLYSNINTRIRRSNNDD